MAHEPWWQIFHGNFMSHETHYQLFIENSWPEKQAIKMKYLYSGP